MLGIDEFRELMKKQAEEDCKRRNIQVTGNTLDDALHQASLELGLPIHKIDYEVLEKGQKGFMGMNRKNWLLVCYEAAKKVVVGAHELAGDDDFISVEQEEDTTGALVDGEFSVRLASDGAYAKVSAPRNGGHPVKFDEVLEKLHYRAVHEINQGLLEEVVKRADGMPVKVGDFIYNPANDPLIRIEVSDDEMECSITATEPGPGGADLNAEDISNFLATNGIEHGLDHKALERFEDFPEYGIRFPVAFGDKPVNGADARIVYNFDIDPKGKVKLNPDGTVDFKELNKIQNVVKGQPLAKKIPPQPGKDGRTVYGRYLPAKDGKDVEIGLGKNVTIADGGNTVLASVAGQVLLIKNKITVETVLIIPGNVDNTTGNVSGLGTVVVKGNVEDGFTVKAQGNIEVMGYVARANLSAGGDIIVKKGINGGEGGEFGHIMAGNSLWASFVQNATVESGDLVVVSDGVVNAKITAKRKVLCKGKRSRIVGGHIKASEEINAMTFGSDGGVETILEVGFDPKTKEELEELEKNLEALDSELTDVDRNIQGILKQKKRMRGKLSKDKEIVFNELREKHNSLLADVKQVTEEISKRKEYLDSLVKQGKISASKNVNTGVKIHIRDAVYEVNNPYDAPVTFLLENGFVKTTSYEAIEDDISRPDN
jgi:uncharacterized protein (DUF342 family)